MPDLNSAVDNLIASGWKDEDIKKQLDNVNEMTDSLINQGKTDQEIESELSKLPMFSATTAKPTVNFSADPKQVVVANRALTSSPSNGFQPVDVLPPNPLDTLKQGQGLAEITRQAIGGEPGSVKDLAGTIAGTLAGTASTIANVPAAIIPRGITEKLGELSKQYIRDPTQRAVESVVPTDTIAGQAAASLLTALPETLLMALGFKTARNAIGRRITGENAQIAPLSDVSGRTLTNPLTPADRALMVKSGRISPEQAAIDLKTAAVSPENVLPATNKIPIAPIPKIDNQQLIDAAKASRNYAIQTNNSRLFGQAETVLDNFKIPKENRIVTDEIAQAQSNAILNSAKQLRQVAQQRGDLQAEAVANNLINRNGILTTNDVFNPNKVSDPVTNKLKQPESASTAADLNIVAQQKPAVDFNILRNSIVKNKDGTPKEVYHGTSTVFKNFNIEKSKEGLYGKGIYFTDEPAIAGGKIRNDIPENKYGYSSLRNDYGYASPRDIDYLEIQRRVADLKYEINSVNQQLAEGKINQLTASVTLNALKKDLKYSNDLLIRPTKEAPNVRPSYLNLKNPFNINGNIEGVGLNKLIEILDDKTNIPKLNDEPWSMGVKGIDSLVAELKMVADTPGEYITGHRLYDYLNRIYENKDDINLKLQQAGYDSIMHTGGAITGSPPHQVYIAFKPSQVISKFDPRLYKKQIEWMTREPDIINNKVIHEKNFSDGSTGLTDKQAVNKFDVPEYPADEHAAGAALIKRAVDENIDGLEPLKSDVRNYMSLPDSQIGKINQESSPNLFSNLKDANLELDANAIIRPFWNEMANIEAKTGLPLFNELYYKGRINFNEMMDFQLGEQATIDKIYGKYKRPINKYIEGRERISDILEEVAGYNPKTGELIYKDVNGNPKLGTINSAVKDRKWNPQEIQIAAELRDYYDTATKRGAPLQASSYIDYYNPKRHENSVENRAAYFKQFRDNEKPFFSFHRTGSNPNEPWIRDSKVLVERYIREWATVNHMLEWQNDTARPLLEAVRQWENGPGSLSTAKPARYIEKFIRDMMGIPRDNASDLNYTAYKIVRDYIEPHTPKIAQDIYSALSKDRTGEVASSKLLGMSYKNILGYRPLKIIRNFNQRFLADPLMPDGIWNPVKTISRKDQVSIVDGMRRIKTKEGQDKVLASGVLGYVGDMTEKGFSDTWLSPMRGWEAIEKGNRGSIYLTLHDGINRDFQNGMLYSDVAKKYRLNLYHEVVRDKFKELYQAGKVGDVRDIGLLNNAAHFLGDNAQGMTQYWYDKGSGVELFKQGPLWKQAGAFSSYHFLTGNYLANLIKDSYKSPRDLARVMKMLVYVTTMDNIIFNATGLNFQSNPLTNLPSQLGSGPIPTGLGGAWQLISGKYNEMMANMLQDRDDKYAKMQQSEGWRKIKAASTALTPALAGTTIDLYKFLNPEKKPVDITP